jgi:adenylate kinase
MDVILLGPPGAGKGTQALVIEQQVGLTHVASGDLFRAAIKQGTLLGLQAQGFMDRGELVPDELVIRMIVERVRCADCDDGVLFDGFPRTAAQAVALDTALAEHERQIDYVLFLDVPNDVLLRRIAGREICAGCGAIHNSYYFPSRRPGVCDTCGDRLYQRGDDTLGTARHRLEVYFAQTLPLIEYYRRQGKLVELDGQRDIAQVSEAMLEALGLLEALEVATPITSCSATIERGAAYA